MSDIHTVSFSEFGEVITGKTPLSACPEDFGDVYPFITPSDSFDEKYIRQTHRYLSAVGLDKLKGKALPKNSVMVTCIGSAMGKVAMVAETSVTNQQINAIVVNDNYDPHYVYYCLKNNYKLLRNAAGGSTAVPLLNKTEFELLKCSVHLAKNKQEKIGKVLTAIDAKIELNNRIKIELEAMTKTMYDYWFVQFDFHDANGKPYKSAGGKMVYNLTLKREIPEGWETRKIDQVAFVKAGGDKPKNFSSFSSKEYPIPIFSNGISNEGLYGYTDIAKIHQPSITVSARGTIGYSVLRLKPFVPIIRLIVLTPLEESALKYIEDTIKRLGFDNSGSVQQQLTVPQISAINILYPSSDVLGNYTKIVKPIVNQLESLKEQNTELSDLRDWLLPMLMNGQVTVK